jgi:hypothetical protein
MDAVGNEKGCLPPKQFKTQEIRQTQKPDRGLSSLLVTDARTGYCTVNEYAALWLSAPAVPFTWIV